MQNNETRLRELLALYGCDTDQWPKEDQPLWLKAQRHPKLAALIEEERRFERLLTARPIPSPSRDFATRIIGASLARPQETPGWFADLLAEVRPSALAAMLVLGFAIGFGMLAHTPVLSNAAAVKTFADDEGTIL